jgi:hypothetical protein
MRGLSPDTELLLAQGDAPETVLIAHAVLRASDADHLAAVIEPGDGFAIVTAGALAVLVSRRDRAETEATFADADRATALALAHHDLLVAVAAALDLLPVRLGAIYRDEAAVRAMLNEGGEAFAAALARIAGGVEYVITVAESPAAPAGSPVPIAATGRDYLKALSQRRQQTGDLGSMRAAAVDRALEALASEADRTIRKAPRAAAGGEPKRLASVTVLVRRTAGASFEAARRSIADDLARHGLNLACDGPWPPYSFVAGEG